MTKDFLISQLDSITDTRRINRLRVAKIVLQNRQLFPFLLEIVFDVTNKTFIRAAWVLEFVCNEKLNWLAPHFDYFLQNISKIIFGSAVRPVSKICEFLAKSYNSKKDLFIQNHLSKKHIDLIIEACFDWLISTNKVAVKVYSMQTLYLLGKNYDWVHTELALIIQQNISRESGAYKARGKKILHLLKQK